MATRKFTCKKCLFGGDSFTVLKDGKTIKCKKCGTEYRIKDTYSFLDCLPEPHERNKPLTEEEKINAKRVWFILFFFGIYIFYIASRHGNILFDCISLFLLLPTLILISRIIFPSLKKK